MLTSIMHVPPLLIPSQNGHTTSPIPMPPSHPRIQSGKRALASFVATDPAACFPRVWAPQLLFPLAFFFSAWRITSFKKSNYSRLFIVFVRLKLCTYIRLMIQEPRCQVGIHILIPVAYVRASTKNFYVSSMRLINISTHLSNFFHLHFARTSILFLFFCLPSFMLCF